MKLLHCASLTLARSAIIAVGLAVKETPPRPPSSPYIPSEKKVNSNPWRQHELSKLYPHGCLDEQKMGPGGFFCNPEIDQAWKQTGISLNPGCVVKNNTVPKMRCQVGTTTDTQLPAACLEYCKSNKYAMKTCLEGIWTQKHTDQLLKLALERVDFSPPVYPHSVPDLYDAFDRVPVKGLRVMVAGSVSPWVEAVLTAYGAQSVHTMDYGPRVFATNMTQLVVADNVSSRAELYDAIVSFSSIEHDGIGRYGDPINPEGDRAAMYDFKQWLKPSGLLFLGIPVYGGGTARREGSSHRIYDLHRFYEIANGFKLRDVVNKHYGFHLKTPPGLGWWQNQPVFIFSKE